MYRSKKRFRKGGKDRHPGAARGPLPCCVSRVVPLQGILDCLAGQPGDDLMQIWLNDRNRRCFSPAVQHDMCSVLGWLQDGRNLADCLKCRPLDAGCLRSILYELRPLTGLCLQESLPRLIEVCRRAGVAVVVLPSPEALPLGGAVHWLPSRRVILQVSAGQPTRYSLWRQVFHQIGHILLHGHGRTFLEPAREDACESEADGFARDLLLPRGYWLAFLMGRRYHSRAVADFASRVGISAEMVVGELVREGRISRSNALVRLQQVPGWP